MHDENKVVLGGVLSSYKVVESYVGSVEAGKVVRQKSDGTLTTAVADGSVVGASVGKDLSNAGRMSVVRAGLRVPVLLKAGFTTPAKGAQVHIDDATGEAMASGVGATGINATYSNVPGTVVKTGLKEDGTTQNVALVDFVGGP